MSTEDFIVESTKGPYNWSYPAAYRFFNGYYGKWGNWQSFMMQLKKDDAKVISYRGRKPRKDEYGFRKPNAFSVDRLTLSPSGASWKLTPITGWPHIYEYDGYFPFTTPPIDVTKEPVDVENECGSLLSQARNAAYGDAASPDCPGLTWIAEGRETLKMLINPIKALRTLFIGDGRNIDTWKQLKRWFSRTRQNGSTPSDWWLQYRYAIMPLILQIGDIIKLLDKPKKQGFKASGYETSTSVEFSTVFWYPTTINKIELKCKTTIKKVAAVNLYVASKQDPHPYGTGIVDAIAMLWEVTRLSFVWNWFFDLGGWIAAIRPAEVVVRYQTNTCVYERVDEYFIVKHHDYNGWKLTSSSYDPTVPILKRKRYKMVRTTDVTGPTLFPTLQFEKLSLQRAADAVALLIKFTSKR